MKKSISILLVLLIIAGAAGAYYFFFWKRAGALGDLKAAEYVPSQTGALIEITDWQRTKTRWKETALYKISQEPEVAEFLEKPESKIPADKQLERLARFQKLEPKEVFVAFTAIGVAPKVVAGFDYKGSQADAEALVEDLKGDLKDQYPDGKSDIEKYGESNIETFANKEETMATVFKGKWFFISNDTGLLKETLDRVDGKTDVKTSLRENESYKTALAKLPKDSDGVVFIGRGVIGPLIMMASMSPGVESAEVNELMKIDSISASMKLDGENIRDAFYVNKPGGGKAEAPLARNSLAYTTAGTVLYFTTAIPLDKAPVMPNPALDRSGILSAVDNFRQMLAQAGLGFDDFKSAYGPEMGLVTNWEQDSLKPDWMLALDVRDKEKAQKFIETLTAGHGGAAAWAKQEIDGTQFYSMPQSGGGLIPVSPVLALTDKSVLFGMDVDSVKKAAQRAKADGAGIDKDADFQAASGLVSKPRGPASRNTSLIAGSACAETGAPRRWP